MNFFTEKTSGHQSAPQVIFFSAFLNLINQRIKNPEGHRKGGFLPALVLGMVLMSAVSLKSQSITINAPAVPNGSSDDLFVAFRSPAGQVQTSTDYMIDLGQATLFTTDSTQILNLGQYGSDLSTIFGSSWYANTGVLWGAMATAGSAAVTSNGTNDPAVTIYVSAPTTAVGTAANAWLSKTAGAQATAKASIGKLLQDFNGGQYNSSYNGTPLASNAVAITSSDSASWSSVVKSLQSQQIMPEASFTNSNASNAVLDLFRMAPTLSGTAPGQNVGYLSIDNSGNMTFTPLALTLGSGGGGGSNVGPWNWTAGSGNWSSSANWQSNNVASNGVAAGILSGSGGTITNDAVTTLSSLTFSNAAGGYTLTGTNASQTLAVTGGLTNNSSATETIALGLTGAGNVTQNGAGTLILSASNGYSGGTILNGGTVVAGNNSSFGSGAITIQSNATIATGASSLSTTNAVSVAGGANLTIDSGANAWQNSGIVSGVGSLSKAGTGTLTLSGSSTNFQGSTAVNAGTLQISGNLGAGTVTVNSGASLAGTGTMGALKVSGGASLSSGLNGGVGQLSVTRGLTLDTGSTLNWKLADASSITPGIGFDSFSVGGVLSLNSSINFNLLNAAGGTANFLNNQNSQWLVASAGSILGFSTNDFTINLSGFTNALGGGSFTFATNALGGGYGLYLDFIALGVNPWTGNIAAGSNAISGQTVTGTNSAVIGANASRAGSVNISNNGSWIIPGNLTVGGSTNGSGSLTIGTGGSLQANALRISDQAGSKGLVLITNGASPTALSLGSGTISFGQGNGQLQFAQSGAEIVTNAITGKGMIVSSGTGTTTFSANNSGFSGTNYLSSGTVVVASGAQLGGSVNIAGQNAVLALNTNATLTGTGPVAVAGTLLDNSKLSFTNAIKGQVVLAPTGTLQKTYTNGASVAGFGAGIGAGKTFSILAGTAASNTLSASLVNGALNFKGTYTNAAVLSLTDPSFSAIKNTIQWYNTNTSTWQNTIQGNGKNGAVSNASSSSIISGLGSNARLWTANGFLGSFNTFLIDYRSLNLTNGLASLNALSTSLINSDLNSIMGTYGYDASTHSAWAVIDHNSIFDSGDGSATPDLVAAALADAPVTADLSVFNSPVVTGAVPEPGEWGLISVGALFLIMVGYHRRRRPPGIVS